MKVSTILAGLWCLFCVCAQGVRAGEGAGGGLHIFAEILPPYATSQDGQLSGISTEILLEMLARAGRPESRDDFTPIAWARGYAITLERPNTLLYSTVFSDDRKDLFTWVGPIMTAQVVVLAEKSRGLDITDPQALGRYRIGVSRNSVGHQLLMKAGVPEESIVPLAIEGQSVELLPRGRVDLWVGELRTAMWELDRLGYSGQDFVPVYTLTKQDLYFALNKDTDPATIMALQAALDSMKADGTDSAIIDRYLRAARQQSP